MGYRRLIAWLLQKQGGHNGATEAGHKQHRKTMPDSPAVAAAVKIMDKPRWQPRRVHATRQGPGEAAKVKKGCSMRRRHAGCCGRTFAQRWQVVAGVLHMVVHANTISNWDCCYMVSRLLYKQRLTMQGWWACHKHHRTTLLQHLTCCGRSFAEAQARAVKGQMQ